MLHNSFGTNWTSDKFLMKNVITEWHFVEVEQIQSEVEYKRCFITKCSSLLTGLELTGGVV